jgi:hypothetical protein
METISRFLEAYRKGQIKTPKDVSVFIDSIRLNDSAAPLPVTEQSIGEMAA